MLSRRRYCSSSRAEISPAERLALTIHYLATGNSQVNIGSVYNFFCCHSITIYISRYPCHLAPELADQLFALFWRKHAKLYTYAELKKDFVKAPTSAEEWEGICREFHQWWNFPHCLGIIKANWSQGYHDNTCLFLLSTGAIDGKHIVVQAPINSGSLYYNYIQMDTFCCFTCCL